jgi:hypothetical protein
MSFSRDLKCKRVDRLQITATSLSIFIRPHNQRSIDECIQDGESRDLISIE